MVFDDGAHIFQSERFLGVKSFWDFWKPYHPAYRAWPLSYSVLNFIYQYAGENLWVYKGINLFVHILNAFLLLQVTRLFSKSSFLIALIFLIHPLQIETFSWIFQLKTLLATTFLFLSILSFESYLRSDAFGYLVLTIYLFFLSLMSKPVAVMLPVFLAFRVFRYWTNNRIQGTFVLMPFFALSLLISWNSVKGVKINNSGETQALQRFQNGVPLRTSDFYEVKKLDGDMASIVISNGGSSLDEFPIADPVDSGSNEELEVEFEIEPSSQARLADEVKQESADVLAKVSESKEVLFLKRLWVAFGLTPLFSFFFYITKFLFPVSLSLVYGTFTVVEQLGFIFVGALILGLGIGALRSFQKSSIFLTIYFLSIFPVLGFVYIPYMKFSPVADHWAYLAVAPLAFFMVEYCRKVQGGARLLISLLLIFSVSSLAYIRVFNDPIQRLERAIQTAPGEISIYIKLSNEFIELEDLKGARDIIRRALGHEPNAKNEFLLLQAAFVERELGNTEGLRNHLHELIDIYTEKKRWPLVRQLEAELSQIEKANSN